MSVLNFSFINSEKEDLISKELKKSLKVLGKLYFYDQLEFITGELVNNANKANLKLAYFKSNAIDINSEDVYNDHIKKFKKEIKTDPSKFYEEIKQLGLFVEITFNFEDNNFTITVKNNRKMLKYEKDKIKDKIIEANRYGFINDKLLKNLDTSESAGVGIILIILTLRNMGIDEKHLLINDKNNITESIVSIPLSMLENRHEFAVAEVILNEIDDIPLLPERITALNKKVNDPNADFKDLANIIKSDAFLLADIMKLANSGMYLIQEKIKSIEEAVGLIGFDGIKNIILSYESKKILMEKYDAALIKKEIEHSTEVALFAYELAKEFNVKDTCEEIYTAAMLHDIGKIIINTLHPNVIDQLREICNDKGLNIDIVENFTNGFNHSIVGSLLAEKWKFSENIIGVIKYHHSPDKVPLGLKNFVYTVYFANIIYYYKTGNFSYNKIDKNVLKLFSIFEEEELKNLVLQVSIVVQNNLKRMESL